MVSEPQSRWAKIVRRILHILRVVTYFFLLGAPLGWLSDQYGWGTLSTFFFYALAIVPLAGWTANLSDVLVERTRPRGDRSGKLTLGGAVGAVIDNLSFIILGGVALSQGLNKVVQASIAGAIISNTLLVLGLSFFLGTLVGVRQQFDGKRAKDYAKLLAVIVTAFVLLAFAEAADPRKISIAREFSVPIAFALIALFVAYAAYEFFHWRRLENRKQDGPFVEGMNNVLSAHGAGYKLSSPSASQTGDAPLVDGINALLEGTQSDYRLITMEEENAPTNYRLPRFVAIAGACLGLVILLIATYWVSTQLVGVTTQVAGGTYPITIAGMTITSIKLSNAFLGLILIPVIGSAAEHLNSISNAAHGNTEAAVNNTAGYAIQITLLAAPILVLISAFLLGGDFTFDFEPIELAIFGAAMFIFYAVTEDGEGTIVEGAALLVVYAIFAVATLFFA